MTEARDATRLTRDTEGRQPGDAGYTHGMVFAHEGKLHRIIELDNTTAL